MRNFNTTNKRDEYLGKEYLSKDNKLMKVIDYENSENVTVEFVESGYKLTTSMYRIKNGKVSSPFVKSSIVFDTIEQERVGCIHNVNGEFVKIIAVNPDGSLRYKILDWYGFEGNIKYGALHGSKGIYNPYRLNRDGCYYGEPRIVRETSYNSFINHKWHAMTSRCTGSNLLYNYSDSSQRRFTLDSRLAIIWRDYQNYADWFDSTYRNLNINYKDYDVDKDLMYPFYKDQSNSLKVYSPVTCELLPHDLNIIISDNKEFKSEAVRIELIQLGNKYYSENRISKRAYEAIQYIYNGNRSYNISIDIITPGYNIFLPRIDDAPQFYDKVLVQ